MAKPTYRLFLMIDGLLILGAIFAFTLRDTPQDNVTSSVHGVVSLKTGNCMPMVVPDDQPVATTCASNPAIAEIYLYRNLGLDTPVIPDLNTLGEPINSTISNAQGEYSFNSLPPGTYTLIATTTDHETKTLENIDLQTTPIQLDLTLDQAAY
ncbi:MAG: carboxypeptidase-like regulatory domain-containing protein [Patescibacteria group bacterium]